MVVIGNSTFGAPAVDVEEAVLSFKEAAVTGALGSCCPSRETGRPQCRKRVWRSQLTGLPSSGPPPSPLLRPVSSDLMGNFWEI